MFAVDRECADGRFLAVAAFKGGVFVP